MTDDLLFQAYLDGKATPGQGLFQAVGKDPVRYGNLVSRIAAHKKEKEVEVSVMERFQKELKERNYPRGGGPPTAEEEEEGSIYDTVKTWCCCRRKTKKSD